MTYIKIIGAVLVMLSSSMLGLCFCGDIKKRIEIFQEFRNLLCIIRSGIEYNRLVLSEILEGASTMVNGEAARLCNIASDRLMEDERKEFYTMWEESVIEAYKSSPVENDVNLMLEAGKVMGLFDVKLRISGIDANIAMIDEKIKVEQAQMPEKCRVIRNLGFLSGLFLTIVLI